MTKKPPEKEQFSDKETKRRMDKALKSALAMPPKPKTTKPTQKTDKKK